MNVKVYLLKVCHYTTKWRTRTIVSNMERSVLDQTSDQDGVIKLLHYDNDDDNDDDDDD
jgi:hypothetical protein